MKLVIDIPESLMNGLCLTDIPRLETIIANGTPLDIPVEEATERFKKEIENGFYIDHATSPFKGTTTDIDYGG